MRQQQQLLLQLLHQEVVVWPGVRVAVREFWKVAAKRGAEVGRWWLLPWRKLAGGFWLPVAALRWREAPAAGVGSSGNDSCCSC